MQLGILQLSESLAKKVDEGKTLKYGQPEEVELRATSITAYELILHKAKELYKDNDFTANQLDCYLWTIGKDPNFRVVPRHSTRDTVFY